MLVFELAQDLEVWWALRRQEAAGRRAGSSVAGSCRHRHPARALGELALTALGHSTLVSLAGAQADGLALVTPQPCPGDGSGGQCLEPRPLQTPVFFWQEDLCHQDMEFLRAQLTVLSTKSNKHRAKTDRRKQHSIFRDVLRFIEVLEAGGALPCPACGHAAAAQLPGNPPLSVRAGGRAGLVPRSLLVSLSPLRAESTRRRLSDLAWSACTWTAERASGPTKPLRRCWAPASATTSG